MPNGYFEKSVEINRGSGGFHYSSNLLNHEPNYYPELNIHFLGDVSKREKNSEIEPPLVGLARKSR